MQVNYSLSLTVLDIISFEAVFWDMSLNAPPDVSSRFFGETMLDKDEGIFLQHLKAKKMKKKTLILLFKGSNRFLYVAGSNKSKRRMPPE